MCTNSTLFLVLLALLITVHAKKDYTNQYREDLKANGATPEQLVLFDLLYADSTRPTLVCFCHRDANVTTCGVNGKRYLNECSARCAHVNRACVGDGCGDCAKYKTDNPVALKYSSSYNGTVYKTIIPSLKNHGGRRLLVG